MSEANRERVREFFAALQAGQFPPGLLASDMTIWTVTSGTSERQRFEGGVRLLYSLFGGSLTYHIESLTAQEDRVAAEVHSAGTLLDGASYHNDHVFIFRLAGGRIAAVREFMNQTVVTEKIAPAIKMAMAAKKG